MTSSSRLPTRIAQATLALRLPMHGGFATFDTVVDLPFVARRSARDARRHEARARPAARRTARAGVVRRLRARAARSRGADASSTATSRWSAAAAPLAVARDGLRARDAAASCRSTRRACTPGGYRYEDLVRAVDVVVTKPGYGIIAECLANDTALLYTSRGHFIEYDVLVAAMPRFLRTAFIDHADLFAGRWQSHLDRLLAQPDPPERPATNGAEIAVDHLLATALTGAGVRTQRV